jgi:hypothetical protein
MSESYTFNLIQFCVKAPLNSEITFDDCSRVYELTKVANELKKSDSSAPCQKLSDEYSRDNCHNDYAFSNQDSSACEKISTHSGKKDICFQNIAKLTGEVSLCEKITHNLRRDICYLRVSQKLNDLIICEKILDYKEKTKCNPDAVAKD